MNLRTGITLVAVLALLGTGTALYHNHRQAIYREGWDDAHAQIQEQLDLQDAANREAMRLAEKQYARTVDAITLERDRLNEELVTLNENAALDPDAGQCGIGRNSVQRLNSLR